jgi:hypothetical protein
VFSMRSFWQMENLEIVEALGNRSLKACGSFGNDKALSLWIRWLLAGSRSVEALMLTLT